MDKQPWFRAYRITFYVALVVVTLVRLYFVSGFGPELADRARDRFPGDFDINLWLARIGSAAFVVTIAAAAAVVVSLATRAYMILAEGTQRS